MRDLVAAIFPRVRTLEVFLAYSEILGFLMYLEDEKRVVKLVEETRDRYRLVRLTRDALSGSGSSATRRCPPRRRCS